jgi:hypothetical protein
MGIGRAHRIERFECAYLAHYKCAAAKGRFPVSGARNEQDSSESRKHDMTGISEHASHLPSGNDFLLYGEYISLYDV